MQSFGMNMPARPWLGRSHTCQANVYEATFSVSSQCERAAVPELLRSASRWDCTRRKPLRAACKGEPKHVFLANVDQLKWEANELPGKQRSAIRGKSCDAWVGEHAGDFPSASHLFRWLLVDSSIALGSCLGSRGTTALDKCLGRIASISQFGCLGWLRACLCS